MGTKKNWVWRAASSTWWARVGLQSWKIGSFWWAVDIFALFLWACTLLPQLWHCLKSWNQLRNLRPKKGSTGWAIFTGQGKNLKESWKSSFKIFDLARENGSPGWTLFLDKGFSTDFSSPDNAKAGVKGCRVIKIEEKCPQPTKKCLFFNFEALSLPTMWARQPATPNFF